jgi:hypothetical protein
MTNEQFTRAQALRDELQRARRAFSQSPSPALSSSIRRIARSLRHHSVTLYHVECTDTYGGEANYCWVRRFAVRASSFSGAARVAARHLGYSGRIVCDGQWGAGGRWNVRGQPVCFFVSWPDDSRPAAELANEYPLVNGKEVQ